MQMFHLDRPTAEEFFEIYQGVLPEFTQMTEQMTTGPCIAMEIRQENAVRSFRELVGPMDPEIAKNLRPNTLRARFGIDRCRNAIHCTDLPEDGTLESEYFFSIQQEEWKFASGKCLRQHLHFVFQHNYISYSEFSY